MRVAIVTASYPFGVTESFLTPELAILAEMGWEVTAVPVWARGVRRPEASVPTLESIRRPLSPPLLGGVLMDGPRHPGAGGTALKTILTARHWRAIATNIVLAPSGFALARAVTEQRIDHIHAYWANGAATVAMIASQVTGVPWSFTGHRGDVREDGSLEMKLRSAVVARLIGEASRTVALATLQRGGMSAVGAEALLATKGVIRRLGVEVPDSAPGPGEAPVLLCPASLLPVKGHRQLIDAMETVRAQVPGLRLDLAGEGPLRQELEALVARLGLGEVVRFLGMVPHRELLERYARAEYAGMVLPSLDLGDGVHEGIPVALMEAMAHGVPVVTTRTGGIPELVVPGTGWMVAERDVPALAAAIGELLTDRPRARAVGEAGRQRVVEEFEVRRSTRGFWQEVAARSRKGLPQSRGH